MSFLILYVNVIRAILLVLTIYYLFKRNFKTIKSTVLVFVLTFLLTFMEWIFDIKVDRLGSFLYYTIIFLSLYLGSALKFYDRYAWWDIMLHSLCGVMFISFGIAISEKTVGVSKFGILLFSFTLANTLHVIWEIAEYLTDCIYHSDAQRWQKHFPTRNHLPKFSMQPAGLVDTMHDMIVCFLGAFMACVGWWFFL